MSAERLNSLGSPWLWATAQLVAKLTSLQAVVLLLVSGLVVGRVGLHWVELLDWLQPRHRGGPACELGAV